MVKEETNGTRASSNRNEVTLGVMGEQIKNLEGSITGMRTDIKELGQKIDDKYVTRTEHKAELADIIRDVDSLKDNNKWVVRLVVGSLITSAIAMFFITR
jgi:predicted RNase H-like nuclease (RuvC/YqgF family)